MSCIGPVTPDDIELLAYADNAASLPVLQHLSACPDCRLRAFRLRQEQRTLQTLLRRADCPASLALGEYHLGLTRDPRADDISGHLGQCPACRSEIAELAEFLRLLRRPLADAAGSMFAALRTVVARLSPGPAGGSFGALAPAVRSAGDDLERTPLMYAADDVLVTVDTWVERVGQSGRVVAGLVVGPADFSGAEASIDADEPPRISPIDGLGNFLFSDVPPGAHQLMVRLPSTGIQIEIDELIVK